MQFLSKKGIAVYFLVLAVHCICIYLSAETPRLITKVLLVPVLMGWVGARDRKHIPAIVYAGLAFCFAGDVLLAGTGTAFFLSGMLCFIVAHICNSIYFIKLQDPLHSSLRESFFAAAILIFLSAFVFFILNSHLGTLRIPVLVYMLVISIMAILAVNTAANKRIRNVGILCFIPGAGLFVLSDAVLAINKFMAHQPMLDIVVMATYGGALYFLAKGFVATDYGLRKSK
jgi:uncharacterized membrane protein YhhN